MQIARTRKDAKADVWDKKKENHLKQQSQSFDKAKDNYKRHPGDEWELRSEH